MSSQTIAAYDVPERVAAYDAGMQLMHPNREKMIQIALEMLPFRASDSVNAIDLGAGTGYFSAKFLDRFPTARVTAVDGAAAMLELARLRLGPSVSRVHFIVHDFRNLAALAGNESPFDAVFSSFALHHLNADEKADLIRQADGLLRPGGWFINADIVRAETATAERCMQEIRVNGIVRRAAAGDTRFRDAAATRQYLDELEACDGDQPQTLHQDLAIAQRGGLSWVEVLWKEYREVVYGGQTSSDNG
jgi:ubiquinone/menaquinone biosynthesis C-methylase UbiE